MPYACYAHNSMKKLIDLEKKGKDISIPSPHHYYEYRTGNVQLGRLNVFPATIKNYNYSVLEKSPQNKGVTVPRLVETDEGDVYLFIPYNAPIFLMRR